MVLLLLCGVLLSGWLAYVVALRVGQAQIQATGLHRLELYTASLQREISKYAFLPGTLDLEKEVLALMNSLTTVLERDSVRQATRLRAIQTGAFVLALANFLLIVFGMLRHFREVEGDSHRWRELARHDPLTGLSNRKGFTEAALAILTRAQMENAGGAVMMLDLDGFKPINDRYGHAMGDQILVRLADKLASAARATDVVARLGGDEFAILCPKLQGEDIEQFCSRLLTAVASAPADETPGCRLGGSIGIACYPQDGHSLEHLLNLADRAMYAAKNAGGHRWHIA